MFRIMKYLSKAEIGQMLIALVTIVGQVYFDLKLPDYMSDITTLVETPGSDMKDIWICVMSLVERVMRLAVENLLISAGP